MKMVKNTVINKIFETNLFDLFKCFFIIMLISFLSTNIYWILTAPYTEEVLKVGLQTKLNSLEAAKYIIVNHGLTMYLNKMMLYFSLQMMNGFFALVIMHRLRLKKALYCILMLSFLLALCLRYKILYYYVFRYAEVQFSGLFQGQAVELLLVILNIAIVAIFFAFTAFLTIFVVYKFKSKSVVFSESLLK